MKKHNIMIDLEELMWQKRVKSITELSEKSGISRATLHRILKGEFTKLNVSTLISLCESLDCSLEELLIIRKV